MLLHTLILHQTTTPCDNAYKMQMSKVKSMKQDGRKKTQKMRFSFNEYQQAKSTVVTCYSLWFARTPMRKYSQGSPVAANVLFLHQTNILCAILVTFKMTKITCTQKHQIGYISAWICTQKAKIGYTSLAFSYIIRTLNNRTNIKITSTTNTPIAHPPKSIFHCCHLVSGFSTG